MSSQTFSPSKIKPSSALIVRADTPTADCVRLMCQHDVGSLLIVNDRGKEQKLIGIFTERDLIRKFEMIQKGNHWSAAIRTVMTRPVKTLELSRMDLAAELMIENHFRHVPIIMKDKDEKEHIVGVISMRDLFYLLLEETKKFYNRRNLSSSDAARGDSETSSANATTIMDTTKIKPVVERKGPPLKVGVANAESSFLNLLEKIPMPPPYREVACLFADLDKFKKGDFDLVVIDIDDFGLAEWPVLLKQINEDSRYPKTWVLFSPPMHEGKTRKILERLSNSEKFLVIPKPVDVIALTYCLQNPD